MGCTGKLPIIPFRGVMYSHIKRDTATFDANWRWFFHPPSRVGLYENCNCASSRDAIVSKFGSTIFRIDWNPSHFSCLFFFCPGKSGYTHAHHKNLFICPRFLHTFYLHIYQTVTTIIDPLDMYFVSSGRQVWGLMTSDPAKICSHNCYHIPEFSALKWSGLRLKAAKVVSNPSKIMIM